MTTSSYRRSPNDRGNVRFIGSLAQSLQRLGPESGRPDREPATMAPDTHFERESERPTCRTRAHSVFARGRLSQKSSPSRLEVANLVGFPVWKSN